MSQASSSPRSSAHLDALTQEIEKKLQRALASPSQRRNLLQELFADIALEIDERAKGEWKFSMELSVFGIDIQMFSVIVL
ncbi:hypothetical protein ACFX2I_006331 [Malus domestica]